MLILFIVIILIILYYVLKVNQKQNISNNNNNSDKITKLNDENELPYKTKYILTKTEYSFYKVLKPLIEEKKYFICPKVGLKDIVYITTRNNYNKWFAKISQKHVDFLICDSELKPLFAIELDDKSHDKAKAIKNDTFKNNLFNHIGFPLKRIKVGNYTDLENILFPNEVIKVESNL